MRIGPKYKIARRLGVPIFDKTQTQKFVLSQSRKEKGGRAFVRPKSDYGMQLLEKQKARFTYGITERQFSKYAKAAIAQKNTGASQGFFQKLELRADNICYRVGLAPSRQAGRQLISHGHMLLNGRRITVPSAILRVNDTLKVREVSVGKKLFASWAQVAKDRAMPEWLSRDIDKKEVRVIRLPVYEAKDAMFDINSILEFYSR